MSSQHSKHQPAHGHPTWTRKSRLQLTLTSSLHPRVSSRSLTPSLAMRRSAALARSTAAGPLALVAAVTPGATSMDTGILAPSVSFAVDSAAAVCVSLGNVHYGGVLFGVRAY